jgi:hypothetical protein
MMRRVGLWPRMKGGRTTEVQIDFRCRMRVGTGEVGCRARLPITDSPTLQ